MKAISHYTWVHLKKGSNLVLIRVRWNSKKTSVEISTECNADPARWDLKKQRAAYNTTHHVNNSVYTAKQINNRIESLLELIEDTFAEFAIKSIVPSGAEFKIAIGEKLNREQKKKVQDDKKSFKCKKTFREQFNEFLRVCASERNWAESVHHKYDQIWNQINAADPSITLEKIDKDEMLLIRNWFVDNGYKNVTINKQFKILKSLLRWFRSAGYKVNDSALEFKTNLVVVDKTVTYLTFDELQRFAHFEFPEQKKYLDKARDMFVFMSNTSLRISDLRNLRYSHINNNCIDIYTKKTHDRVTIPLTEEALRIYNKYKKYEHDSRDTIFLVPSSQKLNEYYKEAAELAGLEREVNFVYYVGAKRFEENCSISDIISNHMARRTFVVCSLSMGIPAEIVMKATGHKDYESMKPYIAICDDTQKIQMTKWNKQRYKSQIIELLDKADKEELEAILHYSRGVINV